MLKTGEITNLMKFPRSRYFILGLLCGLAVFALLRIVGAAYALDGNVIPSADYTYHLGTATARWNSINSSLYFDSSGNVGVGAASPAASLEVNGGVRLTTATKPTCDSTQRGTLWYTPGGAGKDVIEVCAKDAGNSYAWRAIY